ncbi:hypothetical protein [Nocardia asteroides]|nr:hypothetical protein [Nocardia asteroides]UGT50616.1 hypothetical protein LT345_08720 [Nocardia asteroides]SFN32675.1 hypothetical protein SAMN05444423_108128 [Nocardia asteroides]VEG36562.1 FAD-dependent oxidoreductase [Nocardia asteroides]
MLAVANDDVHAVDTHGHAFTAYAATPGTHILIRPDGHLARRWDDAPASR